MNEPIYGCAGCQNTAGAGACPVHGQKRDIFASEMKCGPGEIGRLADAIGTVDAEERSMLCKRIATLEEGLAAALVEMEYAQVMRAKLGRTTPAFSGTLDTVVQKTATLLCKRCGGAGAYLEQGPMQDDPTPYKCEACDRDCNCTVGSHFKDCPVENRRRNS